MTVAGPGFSEQQRIGAERRFECPFMIRRDGNDETPERLGKEEEIWSQGAGNSDIHAEPAVIATFASATQRPPWPTGYAEATSSWAIASDSLV